MDHALIVTPGEKAAGTLSALVREPYPHLCITTADSCAAARRLLGGRRFDLLLLSAPLADETGVDLCCETAEAGETGVILLVKGEYAEETAARVEEYGVFVVEKPLHKPFFLRALRLLAAANSRVRGMAGETQKLQQRIDELRVINRAKCVLIQYLGLTEPQAHRHIEKQAMDLRQSKLEVAQGVLRTYES